MGTVCTHTKDNWKYRMTTFYVVPIEELQVHHSKIKNHNFINL